MKDVKVAVAQMNSTDNYVDNLASTVALIAQAGSENVEILLLPENFMCFSALNSLNIAQEHADELLLRLAEHAKLHQLTLILGSFPIQEDDQVMTQSIVISNEGKVVSRYNKIHLFKAEVKDGQGSYDESQYFGGGNKIENCLLTTANLGLSICYDLRFPELYQQLRFNGAEILTVPAAFTHTTGKAHWLPLLQARAIETQCFVLAANQCGWHSDTRQTWGHSCIISPWGEILAMAEEQPTLLITTLRSKDLQQARSSIPVWSNKRL